MGRQQRRYTPEDIAATLASLAANDGNIQQTAADTGVPRSTIKSWAANSSGPTMPDDETRRETTEALGVVWERVARSLLSRIEKALETPADPAKVKDDIVGAAVATDKVQLLTGQPTSRVVMTNEQRAERAMELINLAAERKRRASS